MKLIKIVNAVNNLNKLSEMLLPAKESFKIIKLMQKIEPELQNYNVQRNKLLAKYGDSEDGKTFVIKEEEKENFTKEIIDLENIEIDFEFDKIKISEKLTMKASDLINITDFVEIVGDENGI
jgi:hypothetical protein